MKMPEKDPSFWSAALAWLTTVSPQLYALALSVVVAVTRVIYGGGTRRQALMEGALCGLVTLTIVPLLTYFNLPENMAAFAGGFVGFLGVEKIRAVAERYVNSKVDKQ
ncbi:phage holin, lambda family [Pseudomonas aeruginosa]|nr:phage holin, lambda family [Pseudomonas aeruginosa]